MPHAETHMVMKRKKPGGGINGSIDAVPAAVDAHQPSSLSPSSASAVKLDPAPAVNTSVDMFIDLTLSDSDNSESRGPIASSDQRAPTSTPEQPVHPPVQQPAVSATPRGGGLTGSCGTLSTHPQQLSKPEKPMVSVGHAKKVLVEASTGASEAKGRANMSHLSSMGTPAHTTPPPEAGGARLPAIPTRNEEDANGLAVAQLSTASDEKRVAIERLNRMGLEVVMPAEAAGNSFDPRDSLPSAESTTEIALGKFSASAVVVAPTSTGNDNKQSRGLPYPTEAYVNRSVIADSSSGEINDCRYNKKDNGDSSGKGRQTDTNMEAKTSENGDNDSDNTSNEDDVSVVSPTSSSSAESGSGNIDEEGDSDDVRGVSSSSSFVLARDGTSDNDSSSNEKGACPLSRSLESEVEMAWGPKRKKQKHFHEIGRDAAGRSDREAEEMADSFSKSVGQAQTTVVDDKMEKNTRVEMEGDAEKAALSSGAAAVEFRLQDQTAAPHRRKAGTDQECKKDFAKQTTQPIVQRSLPSSATTAAVAPSVAEATGGSESSSFSARMRKGEEWNRQLRQGILMADDSSDNDSDNARKRSHEALNSSRRSPLAGDTQNNSLKDRLPLEEAPPSLLVPSEEKSLNSIEDKGRKTGLASSDSTQCECPVPKVTGHDSGSPGNNIYNKVLPPLFPKATLDFLDARGVETVTDLTMTDTHQLARDLYDSTGFKLGCALTAWKFNKTLEEVAAFKLASSSVILWKRSLSKWLAENGASSDSIQQSRKQVLQGSRPTVPVNESLNKIMSYSDCSFLRKNFGIETAAQLLCADKHSIVKRLRRNMEQQMSNSEDRAQIKKEGFCSGIVHSWLVHVKEAVGLGLGDTFAPVSGEHDTQELRSSASVTKTDINKHVQKAAAKLQVQEQKQPIPVERMPPTSKHQTTPEQALVSGGKPNQTSTRELPEQQTLHCQSDQPEPSYQKNHEETRQIRKMFQKLANRCQDQKGPALQQLLQHTKQLMRQLEAQIQQMGTQNAGHQIQDTLNLGSQQSGTQQRRSVCKKVHNGGFSPLQQQMNQKKIAQLQDLSINAGPTEPMKTPLPYADIKFLRANGIHSDEHLLSVDQRALSDRYAAHKSALPVPFKGDAEVVVKSWMASAQKVIFGKETGDDILPSPVPSSEHEEDLPLMDNVKKRCQTIVDEISGRPRRNITSFDCANDILYDFVIETRESSIPGAGLGAFLTYKGARVLKKGKRQPPIAATPALTRKILHASFSDGRNGVSVTLTGEGLHGDERFMGRSDGVGLWKQYCPDTDFEPTKDNVTFCSHDFGSGLIELGRYAPLLPTDRKTDLVFGVKNFIFSFEPSSWRFDVSEELYGHQQVVDFTSDTTGEPHEVAKSNIAMYVNEVGHNPDHLENVLSKEGDGRTVLYFLYIKKPIRVGQSFELLADYKIGYEEMRERKGYGRANIEHDTKCDKDDCTRLQRNIKERTDLERVIRSYTEADIESVLHFIRNRVLDGLIASTSVSVVSMKSENASKSNSQTQISFEITLRQWVARRRLHWISVIMMSQLKSLCSRTKSRYDLCSDTDLLISVDESDSGNSEAGIRLKGSAYKEGMLVYVNGWESPNDPRPAYTGLATVESVSERENGDSLYTLGLERNRTIKDVPEGVLTHPQEEDVANSSKRIHSAWCRMKESESRPQRLRVMQETLKSMEWNSYINGVITSLWARRNPSAPVNKKARFLFEAIHLELSEEVLYNLSTQRHLLRPFDDTLWCPLSISLLRRLLRHLTFFSLSKDTVSAASQGRFLDALMRCASEAAKRIRAFGQMNGKQLQSLALKRKQSKIVDNKQVSSMEDFIMGIPATVPSEYQKGSIVQAVPCPLEDLAAARFVLHVEWYIVRQVICVAHAIASAVAWSHPSSTKMEQSQQGQVRIYSLKKLCSLLEIDHDIVRSHLSKMNPVVSEPTANMPV